MPELRSDLERLARIPSIAFPGYPQEPVPLKRYSHLLDARITEAAARFNPARIG